MTSYQKLKLKCEYLQSQVDIFKNAFTVVRQDPQVVEDFSQDSISLTMRTLYSISENVRENEINEDLKRRLNRWAAFNLDKETIERLLKLKEELK